VARCTGGCISGRMYGAGPSDRPQEHVLSAHLSTGPLVALALMTSSCPQRSPGAGKEGDVQRMLWLTRTYWMGLLASPVPQAYVRLGLQRSGQLSGVEP